MSLIYGEKENTIQRLREKSANIHVVSNPTTTSPSSASSTTDIVTLYRITWPYALAGISFPQVLYLLYGIMSLKSWVT